MYRLVLVGALSTLLSTSAFGGTCPDRIQYANGNILKNGERYFYSNGNIAVQGDRLFFSNGNLYVQGDRLFYPNGNLLKSGTRLFYSNGNVFRDGNSRVFYQNGNILKQDGRLFFPNGNLLRTDPTRWNFSNGNLLQSGARIFYPNGNVMRSDLERWFYENGNLLQNGERFFYKSGNIARSNSRLFRENGTSAASSVDLESSVGDLGILRALVMPTGAEFYLDFVFQDLGQGLSDLKLVYNAAENKINPSFSIFPDQPYDLQAYWSDLDDNFFVASQIEIDEVKYDLMEQGFNQFSTTVNLPTGFQDEKISVTLGPGSTIQCTTIGDGTSPGTNFTINTNAARVQVEVKPGVDPRLVEATIRRALEEL